tara:strand:+ start:8841 stop:10208 length:1368 start_codon:yes stop_codon:yes gene_type:complete
MSEMVIIDSGTRLSIAPAHRRPHNFKPELYMGIGLGAVLIVTTLGWGMLAQLDAAVIAPGTVRAASSLSAVQTPSGGVVGRVYVANGARVREGDLLAEFANPDEVAQERSLASRVFGLQAEIARLEAGLRGDADVPDIRSFATLTGENRAIALAALAREKAQLQLERAIIRSERGMLRDRRAQIGHQAAGQAEQRASSVRQKQLNDEELAAMQSLLAKGLTTRSRVVALQRASAAYDGEIGASRAEAGRLRSQSEEVTLQMLGGQEERNRQNADRLRLAQTELHSVLPQWQAARTDRSRSAILAPFDGTISAADMPKVGQVIAPGGPLFDLVPASKDYVVEARVSLENAADLAPGQAAKVRLVTFRSADLPPVEGTVERVSAESIEDPRTGEAYYTAQIRVPDRELRSAGKRAGLAGGVRPGTPVEIVVNTKARTAMEYLFGPLLQRMDRVFTER